MGAVLCQTNNEIDLPQPVAYWSRTFSPSQRNYTTTEKECCAIVSALKVFDWCLHSNFKIITDHNALIWLLRQKEPPNPRLARWITYLQQFHFTIEHRAGVENAAADAMSRLPNPTSSIIVEQSMTCLISGGQDPELVGENSSINKIGQAQQKDHLASNFIQFLQTGKFGAQDRLPDYKFIANKLYIGENGTLMYRSSKGNDIGKIFVPESWRLKIIQEHHNSVFGGHFGSGKTINSIRTKYYWPSMDTDIAAFVEKCEMMDAQDLNTNVDLYSDY